MPLFNLHRSERGQQSQPQNTSNPTASVPQPGGLISQRTSASGRFPGLSIRRRDTTSTEESNKDTTIAQQAARITELEAEVASLRQKVSNLEADLRLQSDQAANYRLLGATGNPLRGDTQEKTLFNVCNQKWLLPYFKMKNPRVISKAGTQYLSQTLKIGDTLAWEDLEKALNSNGRKLKKTELERLFPKNQLLIRLGNDIGDGDDKIAVQHIECMVTMEQYCAKSDDYSEIQNTPHIAPDGTTASLYAFQSSARRSRNSTTRQLDGNACLDQGAAKENMYFTPDDVTPNNIIKKIGETFNETWEQPVQTLRRHESFDSTVNYADRQNERVAAAELTMQGFGTHKTQMCMIMDKLSFDKNNPQDLDRASRIGRQVANLAVPLDDDGKLDLFSHELGQPTSVDMRVRGNDIRIMQSMMHRDAPTADQHIAAVIEKYYQGDLTDPSHHQTPVFCSLVTKSLPHEKYSSLRATMDFMRDMKMPFFLKLIVVNPDISSEEEDRIKKLDDREGFDNVDVVVAREPSDITPKNFLWEYVPFVAEAVTEDFLHKKNQGFDVSKVNIRGEGRGAGESLI